MLDKKTFYKKRAVLIFVIFSVLSAGLIGTALYLRKQNLDNRSKAFEENQQNLNTPAEQSNQANENDLPELINIPSRIAYPDEKYSFPIKIQDPDNSISDISLRLLNAPSWIELNNGIITGTPTAEDVGTYKITLEISDGENKVIEEYYIAVKQNHQN